MYSVEGLLNGIDGCRKNIKVLEDAITKERKTIADYRIMIDDMQTAEKRKEEAMNNIHIEVESGSAH